jgi:hypothetical protein
MGKMRRVPSSSKVPTISSIHHPPRAARGSRNTKNKGKKGAKRREAKREKRQIRRKSKERKEQIRREAKREKANPSTQVCTQMPIPCFWGFRSS